MDKLFKILAKGEAPNFLEMMEALNSISDIDWRAQEGLQNEQKGAQNKNWVSNYPVLPCSEFCESCG